MHFSLKTAILVSLACISVSSFAAGSFYCRAYGDAGCSEHLGDVVTDKFIARFPDSKYEIVVVSNYEPYSNGGGVGFAIAGVSPRSAKSEYGNFGFMPARRFIATQRNTGKAIDPYQKTTFEVDLVRKAVQAMMEACDRDKNCDILK